MANQRRSAVKAHTRVVNGRRQTVAGHRRKLSPARARDNARHAHRSLKLKRPVVAAVCATAAVAELGGWVALRGVGLALVTVGIAAIGVGVAARRTTSTSKPMYRAPGTVRVIQPGAVAHTRRRS